MSSPILHDQADLTSPKSTSWPVRRDAIDHHIQNVWSIEEYLAFLNRDLGDGTSFGLDTDLGHWAEDGITTAPQLADYIGGSHARSVEKSR